jgi:hypothetical protein
MAREVVSSKLAEDRLEQLDAFADERGISRSEAVRRLIDRGLADVQIEARLDELDRRLERLEDDRRRGIVDRLLGRR